MIANELFYFYNRRTIPPKGTIPILSKERKI